MGNEGQQCSTRLADRVDELEDTLGPVDPDYAAAFETEAEAVAPAPTTGGPQRLTFLVPHEDTVVNLGQEVAPRGTTKFNGLDTGIAGHTARHIDFQAISEPATTVTIGYPIHTEPEHVRDAVPTENYGYGMATEGIAYHESERQHYVVSKAGDVIIRAACDKAAVLNAKTGVTEVNAGSEAAITAKGNIRISAGGWSAKEAEQDVVWDTDGYASTTSYLTQFAGTLTAVVSGIRSTLGPMKAPAKTSNDMAPGSSPAPMPTGKAAKVAATLGALLGGAAFHGITLHGRGDTTMGAGKYAGLWGNAASGLVSALVAGLFGSTADVKGFLFAGVYGGSEASLAALGSTSVKATSGNVDSYSKKATHITATGPVDFEGGGNAQMSAANAVAVYSHKGGTYILGKKFGLIAYGSNVKIGNVDNTDQCGKASFKNSDPAIIVNDSAVVAQKNDSIFIRLDNHGAQLMTDKGYIHQHSNNTLSIQNDSGFVTIKG